MYITSHWVSFITLNMWGKHPRWNRLAQSALKYSADTKISTISLSSLNVCSSIIFWIFPRVFASTNWLIMFTACGISLRKSTASTVASKLSITVVSNTSWSFTVRQRQLVLFFFQLDLLCRLCCGQMVLVVRKTQNSGYLQPGFPRGASISHGQCNLER